MSEIKNVNLTCIGCPLGCSITVSMQDDEIVSVTGNTCPRGDAYARKEVTSPTRIVTTTVRVSGASSPVVSCKTKSDIPKSMIFDVIDALKEITVTAPIKIGDTLVKDVAGTGVDIVATQNV